METARRPTSLFGGKGVDQNYDEAYKNYDLAAKQSDSLEARKWAELRLGEMYYFGHGVKQDYKQAVDLFAQAAIKITGDADQKLECCTNTTHQKMVPSDAFRRKWR